MVVNQDLVREIQKLQISDYSSYTFFYDITAPYLYKVVISIAKIKEDADVIIQTVYQRIYQDINSLQNVSTFYNWAGCIATDESLRFLNVTNKLMFDAMPEGIGYFEYAFAFQDNEEFIPENILVNNELNRLIQEMIDSLPIICHVVLQYFYIEGVSVGEIASKLGCDETYVRKCIQYIKNNLKNVIGNVGANPAVKLHSMSQIPVLMIIFERTLEYAYGATAVAGVIAGGGVATGGGAVAGSGMAGTVAGGSAAGVAVTGGSAAGATAVATATGLGIGAKIAIGATICATLAGGGIGINHLIQENNKQTEEVVEEVEETDETDDTEEMVDDTTATATEEIVDDTTAVATEEVAEDTAIETMDESVGNLTPLAELNKLLPETEGWTEEDWLNYANSFCQGTNPIFDSLDREYSNAGDLHSMYVMDAWQMYEIDYEEELYIGDMPYYAVIGPASLKEVFADFFAVFSRGMHEDCGEGWFIEQDGRVYIIGAGGYGGPTRIKDDYGLIRMESVDVENKEITFIEQCEYYLLLEDYSFSTETEFVEFEFSLIFEDGKWKVNKLADRVDKEFY